MGVLATTTSDADGAAISDGAAIGDQSLIVRHVGAEVRLGVAAPKCSPEPSPPLLDWSLGLGLGLSVSYISGVLACDSEVLAWD